MPEEHDQTKGGLDRRRFLRAAGTTTAALITGVGAASATSPVAGKLRPDTTGFKALEEVVVTLYEDGRTKVDMEGTKARDFHQTTGYRVTVTGAKNAKGEVTPEQAEATITPVPKSQLPDQTTDEETTTTKSGSGSSSDSGGSIGTLDHNGGDSESDYEGGAWARTEDPPDFDLALTEHWITWTTSGGEADWVHWSWEATAYTVYPGPNPGTDESIWKIEDAGHSYTDWAGSDVEDKVYADYYNYTWSYDYNRTETHHRIWSYGNPNGSLDWETTHWHNGEDAGWLRVDAGIYGNDPNY